jgi:hypothetical protein
MSSETFLNKSVWRPDHPDYEKFVDEVNRLYEFDKIFIQSNFTDLLRK